jgi:hypothetical protein
VNNAFIVVTFAGSLYAATQHTLDVLVFASICGAYLLVLARTEVIERRVHSTQSDKIMNTIQELR